MPHCIPCSFLLVPRIEFLSSSSPSHQEQLHAPIPSKISPGFFPVWVVSSLWKVRKLQWSHCSSALSWGRSWWACPWAIHSSWDPRTRRSASHIPGFPGGALAKGKVGSVCGTGREWISSSPSFHFTKGLKVQVRRLYRGGRFEFLASWEQEPE